LSGCRRQNRWGKTKKGKKIEQFPLLIDEGASRKKGGVLASDTKEKLQKNRVRFVLAQHPAGRIGEGGEDLVALRKKKTRKKAGEKEAF